MKKSEIIDPFQHARESKGYGEMDDQNDPLLMVLRHQDVRLCAHNWKTFQSGAKPGRIVVPSEEYIRETRQIPFEVDPPDHTAYRALMEEWFRRPMHADYKLKLKEQIDRALEELLNKDQVEIVHEFALPVQSRALALLLNIPIEESETWINWGTHVFRSEANKTDAGKANMLYDYIEREMEKRIDNPGEDLYSVLLDSEYRGRKLTKEEVKGAMILIFAGGRDTIINYITNTITYLADHPGSFQQLKDQPGLIPKAVEEFVRYFSPLTHMGRVATEDTQVCEHAVKADTRISLCWASANRDPAVFEQPNEVILDRKRNPHVAFGHGHHICLGQFHARQMMNALLTSLIEKVSTIDILEMQENIEEWGAFKRKVGYESLTIKMHRL